MGDGKRAEAAVGRHHTMGQSVRDSSLFLLKNIGQQHSESIIWQGKSRSPPAIIVRFAHERSDGRKCKDGTGEEAHIVKKHNKYTITTNSGGDATQRNKTKTTEGGGRRRIGPIWCHLQPFFEISICSFVPFIIFWPEAIQLTILCCVI